MSNAPAARRIVEIIAAEIDAADSHRAAQLRSAASMMVRRPYAKPQVPKAA